jgi:hypothetical protein
VNKQTKRTTMPRENTVTLSLGLCGCANGAGLTIPGVGVEVGAGF